MTSFITYGLGQIIAGWLGDKTDPFRLISLGLLSSALMNILIPIFPKTYIMVAIWAVNGFAQALIYPPLLKIISRYLTEQNYAKACLGISISSYLATLFMYLVSPVMIAVASWKLVFFFSFSSVAVFLVIWQFYSRSIKKKYGKPSEHSKIERGDATAKEGVTLKALFISSGLIIIMLAAAMQGLLRDGITTWMPAYLSDVFSLSNELSISTTVILPISSILSTYVILVIRNKWCRNELKLSGLMFTAAVAAIVMLLAFRINILLSVLFLALTEGCVNSVIFLLISLFPKQFEKYGRFSLVTGLIHSCTYVGAAISTYGFAAISENCGWNVTLILWGVIALIGVVCCFVTSRKYNNF